MATKIRLRDERSLKTVVAVLLLLAALQSLSTRYRGDFWLNLTDSEPVGLYRVYPVLGEVQRGELVVMTVPPAFRRYVYGRGWLPEGWALFKHVGAVAGDTYCVTAGTLTVNGNLVGPVFIADEKGRPLPQIKGCRQVPDGHFLPVATRIPRSFDGRYMGAVALTTIKGIAKPIATWE